jgi:hypothetical protein
MDKFIQHICNKLNESNIPVFKALFKKKDNMYYIMADKVLLVIDESKIITICFSVASTPEYAAKVVLSLKSIRCKKIEIGESFIYNEKGEYFGGDDAYKLMEKVKKDKILADFISEQMQKHILINEDCYNC